MNYSNIILLYNVLSIVLVIIIFFIVTKRYLRDKEKRIEKFNMNNDSINYDNRLENLRLATQSIQSHNKKHMIRKFIKPFGFDVEFQLPQYIEYVKEEKIKTTKNGIDAHPE